MLDPVLAMSEQEPDTHNSLEMLRAAASPGYGVVANWRRVLHYSDEPKFFHFSGAVVAPASSDVEPKASGFSPVSREEALLKFLGEAIERYSQGRVAHGRVRLATAQEMGVTTMDLRSLPRPQKPFGVGTSSYEYVRWIEGRDLYSGGARLVPAQLVLLPYSFRQHEPILQIPSSTGAAGGMSYSAAVARGICEVLEREAFIAAFLTRSSPPLVDLSQTNDERVSRICRMLARYRLETYVIDITTDIGIPTMLAVILDRTGLGPAVSLGLKCHPRATDAVLGALMEAQHKRGWIRSVVEKDPGAPERVEPKLIHSLVDRALYWYRPDTISRINFLLMGTARPLREDVAVSGPASILREMTRRLAKANLEACWVDISSGKGRRIGYRVVKVVIPQAYSFYLDERWPYRTGSRLYDLPHLLGWLDHRPSPEELCSYPHPFL